MLDIKFIRENPEKVKQGAKNKGVEVNVGKLLELDKKRREMLSEIEQKRAERNKIVHEVAQKKMISREEWKEEEKRATIEAAKRMLAKVNLKSIEEEFLEINKEYDVLMWQIPNVPFDDVPVGKDESQNVVARKAGNIPKFNFKPKEHWEIGEQLDLIDTERASKVAGSRFYYLKREAALLEFALVNLAFAMLVKKGFVPVIPPAMINRKMAWAMGYLQQTDDEEAYYLPKDDLYLIATSEQTLGAMHAGEILEEKDLPLRYVGFSSCFRREAGSYGKDTKGILRVHQFDKVEMFVFCKPEDSAKEHQMLLAQEEGLMQKLGLAYQVVNICTGDLGTPAARKYDIEAWMPGQQKYRETHSTSNCTDFQARRLNVRYKNSKTNKLDFVHTLNGTAFSMRPLIAILENFQQKDGSVKIPKSLHKYLPFKEIKLKK